MIIVPSVSAPATRTAKLAVLAKVVSGSAESLTGRDRPEVPAAWTLLPLIARSLRGSLVRGSELVRGRGRACRRRGSRGAAPARAALDARPRAAGARATAPWIHRSRAA